MPDEQDIWRAAALLVGLFGLEARAYVSSRMDELLQEGELTLQQRRTWERIARKVDDLTLSCPGQTMN